MNIYRTLFLIVVSVIQISGMFANISSESLQLSEINRKVCKHFKHETLNKVAESTYDLCLVKKAEDSSLNSPICRKETPLRSAVQPAIISKQIVNLPVKKVSDTNQPQAKRTSMIGQIVISANVNAELF
ncbi:MAG TPA: hypothetical protein VGK38_09575 [Prolixibacteraceae bacterium]|jgi:hypothetical protein